MLHLAVDADHGAFPVGHRRTAEQFDQFGHQPVAERRAHLKERPQIVHPSPGERVDDHRHADRTHGRPRRRHAEFGKDDFAQRDDFADVVVIARSFHSASCGRWRLTASGLVESAPI